MDPQKAGNAGETTFIQHNEVVVLSEGVASGATLHDQLIHVVLTRASGDLDAACQDGIEVLLGAPGAIGIVARGVDSTVGQQEDAIGGTKVAGDDPVEQAVISGGIPGHHRPGHHGIRPGDSAKLALGIGTPDPGHIRLSQTAVLILQRPGGDIVVKAGVDPRQIVILLVAAIGGQNIPAALKLHLIASRLSGGRKVVRAVISVGGVHNDMIVPVQLHPAGTRIDRHGIPAIAVFTEAEGIAAFPTIGMGVPVTAAGSADCGKVI